MGAFTEAVSDVVEAEILGLESRGTLYEAAMRAYASENAGVPENRVCLYTWREINSRLYAMYGKARGLTEAQCRVGKSYFWEVGERLGFTGHGHAPGSASGTDATSFIGEIEPEAPPLPGSAKAIEALQELRAALNECASYCRLHDVEGALGASDAESAVTEIAATARLLRDLVSSNRRVPEFVQPAFVAVWHAISSAEGMMRRVYAIVGSEELDRAPRLTSKAITNILKGRTAGMPLCTEPRSLWAAATCGFHGAPCPKCGCRRTMPDTDSRSAATLHCLRCADGRSFRAPEWVPCKSCRRPLEDPKAVDCPACGEPTRLPKDAGALLAP